MSKVKKLTIGFSLNRSHGGPSLFMNRLRQSIVSQKLCRTSYFFDPFVSVNLFANLVHKTLWPKPFFFRADGLYFSTDLPEAERERRNAVLRDGVVRARGVIFQSSFSLDMYQTLLGVQPQYRTIICNGTDLTRFFPCAPDDEARLKLRERLGIPRDSFVFISSAAWRVHKRLTDIANVFHMVRKDCCDTCHLLIIGRHEEQLEAIDDHIISLGVVPNDLLPQYLRASDIYLFFSWLDTCPNSVIEAIACGVPVVCTDQGGTREIVERSSGGVVAIGSDEPFEPHVTDLYHPPRPDYEILRGTIESVMNDIDRYRRRIQYEKLDINRISAEYVAFIRRVMFGENRVDF